MRELIYDCRRPLTVLCVVIFGGLATLQSCGPRTDTSPPGPLSASGEGVGETTAAGGPAHHWDGPFDPAVSFEVVVSDFGTVGFVGQCNLPDGTFAQMGFTPVAPEPWPRDRVAGPIDVEVADRCFSTHFFSRQGAGFPPGEYVANFSTPYHRIQPENIQEQLGPNGSWLTGTGVVDEGSHGKRVDVEVPFTIPDR